MAVDNPVPLVGLDRPNNLKTIDSMGGSYDHIVIDGAAKLETMLAAAIKVNDLVLIPVQPSPYDIWATGDLVEVIKARQEIMEGSPKANGISLRFSSRFLKDCLHLPLESPPVQKNQSVGIFRIFITR